MRTLGYLSAERRAHVATETIEIYAPISHRLGMGKVRGELEDLAFRHLDPEAFAPRRHPRAVRPSEGRPRPGSPPGPDLAVCLKS
jgi:GTP pyrophosphokinase